LGPACSNLKLALQQATYSSLMLAAPALVVPPFLFFKRGREQILDRFGLWNLKYERSLWMHGASLGEMTGLANIALELKKRLGDVAIVGSSTSPTGLAKAREFSTAAKLLPFDHPLYFKSAVTAISPLAFIFAETELWPNLLSHLAKRNVPSFLVNAKISDRTFRRYLKFKPIVSECIRNISHIFAATEEAKDRFIALGATHSNLSLVSNTKYEQIPGTTHFLENYLTHKERTRQTLFKEHLPIVVFSSIRPKEEEVLFKAIQRLEQQGRHLCYIIAPRHAEKFSYFEDKMQGSGFVFKRRTQLSEACDKRFLLLDTVGELSSLLPAADLVFVGGTFADFGGHNPLESAACGVAPVIGPFDGSIKDIVKVFMKNAACLQACNADEVASILAKLCSNLQEVKTIGDNSRKVALSFGGGSRKIVDHILPLLERSSFF